MVGLFLVMVCRLFEQSPLCQMIVKGGFNRTNPMLTNFAFFCKVPELVNGRSNLIYDGFCLSDTIIFAKSQSIFKSLTLKFTLHHQTMHLLRKETTDIEDISHIVCRRKLPLTAFVHQEREVLVVIICIVGENIEYHSAKDFLLGAFRQAHLATNHQQLFIAVGIRIQSRQYAREQARKHREILAQVEAELNLPKITP